LDSEELLLQVTDDGLLLLSSEGGDTLTYTSLIQGLVCSSHGDDESLLLLLHGSRGGLSRGRGVALLPLSGDSGMFDKTVEVRFGGGGRR
jgi:hypothetical protein